jgi:hypothetical protein
MNRDVICGPKKWTFFSLLTFKIFLIYVGLKALARLVMNVSIFWDVAPCSPYVHRRFVETYHLHLQSRKSAEQQASRQKKRSVGDEFLLSWFWTLTMEAILSSEKLMKIRTTQLYIPEDGNIFNLVWNIILDICKTVLNMKEMQNLSVH